MEINKYHSESESETFKIGSQFASNLKSGDVVAFYGDLGAGKTEFVKGICDGLGVKELITSPTFSIMNKYDFSAHGKRGSLFHIDLYRIEHDEELFEIGFNECVFSDESVKLIEWAEKAEEFLPDNRINITILNDSLDSNKRYIRIENTLEAITFR